MWPTFSGNGNAPESSELKYVFRHNVFNADTRSVIDVINQRNGTSVLERPGTTYSADSPDGNALIGTPNGSGVAYLLIQHKEQLGHKIICSVTVFRHSWSLMLLLHIHDSTTKKPEQH